MTLTGFLITAGIVLQPVITAFAFAIQRDGSPFSRDFWL